MALWGAWNPYGAAARLGAPEEPAMYRCRICHFRVELDDVEIGGTQDGTCICTRCYHRLTETEKHMTRQQLIEWMAAVNEVPN